jgi:hypothetical protein
LVILRFRKGKAELTLQLHPRTEKLLVLFISLNHEKGLVSNALPAKTGLKHDRLVVVANRPLAAIDECRR